MKHVYLLIASAMLVAPVWGQSAVHKADAVRARLQQYVQSNDISGAVVVVGGHDTCVLDEAVGLSDIDSQREMKRDTVFRIASMTKPITAMGIMLLAQDGKLSPDDPVEKYIPEFKGQKLAVKENNNVVLKDPERPITLRDLLTHTSGLPGGYGKDLPDAYTKRLYTLEQTAAYIGKQPLQFSPGSKWSYCNAGIDTLGRVIEVVSGKSYSEFLKERIFDPLGMKDTTPFPSNEQLARTATLYARTDGKLVAAKNAIIEFTKDAKHPIPAGGLYSTGPDLAKLYTCLLNKGEANGKTIIKPETLAEMTRTQTGDIQTGFTKGMSYGYGFAVVKEPQGVTAMLKPGTFGHGGAFGTQGWIDPQQDLFFILLIQRSNIGNSDGSDIRKDIQNIAVGALK